jgi:hypothetical protein
VTSEAPNLFSTSFSIETAIIGANEWELSIR